MDSAHETLKAALEAIRDMALNALNQIRASHEERSMGWKCKACQYVKRFTKAVSAVLRFNPPRARCPLAFHFSLCAVGLWLMTVPRFLRS